MTTELLKSIAATNVWSALVPELCLGLLALFLLVLETILPKAKHSIIPQFAILGQVGLLLYLLLGSATPVDKPIFGGLLLQTRDSEFMRIFFVLTSLLVCMLAMVSMARQAMPKVEFYAITLVISAAMMLLSQTHHFILLFVALETVTVGFYILVSYFRSNALTLEAGLKYLIMGALSSGILLFGIVLLYGAAGQVMFNNKPHTGFEFDALAHFLSLNPNNFFASLGIVLVLSGIAFKIGAVPFQIWIPDVYQGAPTPVTAFLAVGSKAAGFSLLLILTQTVFKPYSTLVISVLSVMAVATILFGNLAALTQHNVKRLLGLSGVSHAGYLLLGVIAASTVPDLAQGSIYFYLFGYLLASFAVFGVMVHVAPANDAEQELEHYRDLAKTHPFLATILTVGLGSLAGIPPLAGFMGKFLIFIAAFKAELYGLLAVAVIGVVLSIYYYFGWINAIYFQGWRAPLQEGEKEILPARTPVALPTGVMLAALACASVVLGVYQGSLGTWIFSR